MFAILLHMMKGTPYIYQGEEIGMINCPINDISEVEDIESVNMYHERLANGYKKEEIIASINAKGRDNARTPMQWDDTENAGFTTGTPWLHVNPNYHELNVKASLEDPNSIFFCYQTLIQLRKENPIIVWGDFELVTDGPEQVFMYLRHYEGQTWAVVANFGAERASLQLPSLGQSDDVIISNYERLSADFHHLDLKPYEAFAVKL
ncbi:alpha-glucosidase C-terminal domain-containing protein [Ectobacillus funiculus]